MKRFAAQVGVLMVSALLLSGCGGETSAEETDSYRIVEAIPQEETQSEASDSNTQETGSEGTQENGGIGTETGDAGAAGNGAGASSNQVAASGSGESAASDQTAAAGNDEGTATNQAAAGNGGSVAADQGSQTRSGQGGAQVTGTMSQADSQDMLPILEALTKTDYLLDRDYSSTDLAFVSAAVYQVLNSYTIAQQEARGITADDSGRMRVSAQTVQEIANAMFESAPDMETSFQNGATSAYLTYDSSWGAFYYTPADGVQIWCEIVSWNTLSDGTNRAELRLIENQNGSEVTLGYSTAVLVDNGDAAYISSPMYYYKVRSFTCDINGRDVAIGYPEE
ncbi:MAG: hypothetical protein Q4C60_02355 [Eubacteriales bacterium]|nr:hypothetical protein [Eubacteriales bacterium]